MMGMFFWMRLVQLIHDRVRVQRREADGRGVLRHVVDQHLHLGLDVGFRRGPFEGDLNAVLCRRCLGSLLDRLPELVLEALGNDGNVDLPALRPCRLLHAAGENRQGESDKSTAAATSSTRLVRKNLIDTSSGISAREHAFRDRIPESCSLRTAYRARAAAPFLPAVQALCV